MAYGKEIFRDKYRETNSSLNIIKDNYLELDQEYQRLAKRKEKAVQKLFNLKDMIYKPETRKINFDIQREISIIIKILEIGE